MGSLAARSSITANGSSYGIIFVIVCSLHAARKLRNDRKDARWADKNYKKGALGTAYKSSPTGGSSHAKGIVLEKVR